MARGGNQFKNLTKPSKWFWGKNPGSDKAWAFDQRTIASANEMMETMRNQWKKLQLGDSPFKQKIARAEVENIIKEQQSDETLDLTKSTTAETFQQFRDQSTEKFQHEQETTAFETSQRRSTAGMDAMSGMVQSGKSGFAGGTPDPRQLMAKQMKGMMKGASLGLQGSELNLQQGLSAQRLSSIQTVDAASMQNQQTTETNQIQLEGTVSDLESQEQNAMDDLAAAMQTLVHNTGKDLTNPHSSYTAPVSPGTTGSATDPTSADIMGNLGGPAFGSSSDPEEDV